MSNIKVFLLLVAYFISFFIPAIFSKLYGASQSVINICIAGGTIVCLIVTKKYGAKWLHIKAIYIKDGKKGR